MKQFWYYYSIISTISGAFPSDFKQFWWIRMVLVATITPLLCFRVDRHWPRNGKNSIYSIISLNSKYYSINMTRSTRSSMWQWDESALLNRSTNSPGKNRVRDVIMIHGVAMALVRCWKTAINMEWHPAPYGISNAFNRPVRMLLAIKRHANAKICGCAPVN